MPQGDQKTDRTTTGDPASSRPTDGGHKHTHGRGIHRHKVTKTSSTDSAPMRGESTSAPYVTESSMPIPIRIDSRGENRPPMAEPRAANETPEYLQTGSAPAAPYTRTESADRYALVLPAGAQQPVREGRSEIPSSSFMEEEEDGANLINELFSTRRPQHVGAGLASGLKSVSKGVAFGMVNLIGAPIHGAMTGGTSGFFKGLAVGTASAVVLPVAGVGVAVYQVCRGVANTAEAVTEKNAGKKYDKDTGEWKVPHYSLSEDAEAVKAESVVRDQERAERKKHLKAGRPTMPGAERDVADSSYYTLLGVETTASTEEIRRNYYKLARTCHPDKHPDDPEANSKFQALGEAYQVLADEERRAQYDQFGKEAVGSMDLIDSSMFFTMLFGSECLEPFVGKLKMALLADCFDDAESPMFEPEASQALQQFDQRKREVELALHLLSRIELGMRDDPAIREAWKLDMTKQAQELCQGSFGAPIVESVGWEYENYATQYLGKQETFLGYSGRVAKWQNQTRRMGIMYRAAKTGLKAARQAKDFENARAKKAKDEKKEERRAEKKKKPKKHRSAVSGMTSPCRSTSSHEKGSLSSSSKSETHRTSEPSEPMMPNAGLFAEYEGASQEPKPTTEFSTEGEGEESPQEVPEEDYKAAYEKAAEEQKQMEATLPLIIQTMLQICLLDIEETVRHAVKKVVKDMDVDIETRKHRARVILELGVIMQAEAAKYEAEHKDQEIDMRAKMEEAFTKTVEKAHGEQAPPASAPPI